MNESKEVSNWMSDGTKQMISNQCGRPVLNEDAGIFFAITYGREIKLWTREVKIFCFVI